MGTWRMFFLVLGGAAVLGFVALAALGQGEVLPFALAFVASVASEAMATAAVARRESAVSRKTALPERGAGRVHRTGRK